MNSKQRRKARRDERFSQEKIAEIAENPFSVGAMNDFCPNMYDCRNAQYEFRCFGRYETCKRYTTGDLTLPVNGFE